MMGTVEIKTLNEAVVKMLCPNAWVFIAQMVEHCSATAEAIGSNPVDVPKFFWVYLQLLKL